MAFLNDESTEYGTSIKPGGGWEAMATGKRTICISCETIRKVAEDNCQKQTHWLLVRQNVHWPFSACHQPDASPARGAVGAMQTMQCRADL
mmetsp:Transcript_29459/g.71152  ORF Transcript_29459/g.71152 Transcript_29459/m.71152 type:complete len:91 (+) Transcript_29459:178-450(+)